MVDVTSIISDAAAVARGQKHGKAGMAWRGLKSKAKQSKRKPSASAQTAANKARYAADEKAAQAQGFRKTSQGKWRKPRNVKAYDNAQKASANAAKMGPDTMKAKASTAKPKRTKRNK
jgi:hypothetical protein